MPIVTFGAILGVGADVAVQVREVIDDLVGEFALGASRWGGGEAADEIVPFVGQAEEDLPAVLGCDFAG